MEFCLVRQSWINWPFLKVNILAVGKSLIRCFRCGEVAFETEAKIKANAPGPKQWPLQRGGRCSYVERRPLVKVPLYLFGTVC